jgi:uncharacterized membrane protein
MRSLVCRPVELYDWLLFLHVLSAFALVGALTVFWALVVGTRPAKPVLTQDAAATIVRPANVLVIAGTLGTILFGIWLAIDHDDYQVWDAWILASLVLWAVDGWLGQEAGKAFTKAMDGSLEARRRGLLFHTAASVVVLVILILMMFKPGA